MNRIVLPEFHEAEVVRAEKIDAAVQTILEYLNGSLDVQALAGATQFALADLLEPYSVLVDRGVLVNGPADGFGMTRCMFPAVPVASRIVAFGGASFLTDAPPLLTLRANGVSVATLQLSAEGSFEDAPAGGLPGLRYCARSVVLAASIPIAAGAMVELVAPAGKSLSQAQPGVLVRIVSHVP